MVRHTGIGVIAGLASALLIGVVVQATPLALALYLLAPLPILIVAMGWSHRTGLVPPPPARSPSPSSPLPCAASPSWSRPPSRLVARLPRAAGPSQGHVGEMEWYPTGRLLAWVAVTAAIALVVVVMLSSGDHAAYQDRVRRLARAMLQLQIRSPVPGAGLEEDDLARIAERVAGLPPPSWRRPSPCC